MIRSSWGQRLREVFESMEAPQWEATAAGAHNALIVGEPRYDALKKIRNPGEKVL
jgi:putative proteasome-type protease